MNTKRFNVVRWLIILALLLSVIPMGSVHAAAPDVIGQYKIAIQPQPDGTLSMRYEFNNYCVTTDFPSADFYVGMPNSHFTITAAGGDLSGDTGWVTGSSQSGVKAYVNFRDTPRAGQCFNFWYEFHQERIAYVSGENVSFQYQPSWFDFATITRLEIWWQLPDDQSLISSLTPEPTKQEGWAIWTYDNMGVNAKTDMLNLLFLKAAFPNLPTDTPDQSQSATSGSPEEGFLGLSCLWWIIIIVVIILVVMFLAWMIEDGGGGGGGYSGGGGGWSSLGGGGGGSSSSGGGWGGSSGRSSGCAGCAGCACACAGGGRAGCSMKGFKLPRMILEEVLQALKQGDK